MAVRRPDGWVDRADVVVLELTAVRQANSAATCFLLAWGSEEIVPHDSTESGPGKMATSSTTVQLSPIFDSRPPRYRHLTGVSN